MRFATVFLLVTLFTFTLSQNGSSNAKSKGRGNCPKGWFGAGCLYKCQCINNLCDHDGSCKKKSRCERGWFGPACQYEDVASRGILVVSNSETSTVLTDADNTTCLKYPSLSGYYLFLDDFYPVTWFRFTVAKSEHRDSIEITFRGSTTSRSVETYTCGNEKRAYVDDYTVDIHCQVSREVIMIIITGKGSESLCSLYMSGGRNVALKQTATQSTVYTDSAHPTVGDFEASNAVDGVRSTNIWHDSCSSTKYGDPNPWWSVEFDRTYSVNRYVLYDREKDYSKLNAGFTLSSYGTGSASVFSHTQQSGEYKVKYQISSSSPRSVTVVNVTPPSGYGTMQSCEIEIYGETVCDSGKYGLQCENSCNCASGSDCFVSTGGCPSGCKEGFAGEDCQRRKECD